MKSSTQRRKDAEISAERAQMIYGIALSWFFSALISASLRLCVEIDFREHV
jgi:hypothetical protein